MDRPPKNSRPKLSQVKSSLWSRSLTLAKMTVKSGTQMAAQGMLGMLEEKAKKDQRWADFLKDQALSLSTELGKLKGSAMKVGQALSMYGEHFLPKEANELLKTLQSQSPPLEWKAIEKILRAELGARFDELEIEDESIGSASLGQVHRARVKKTGELIALKVQYPGVDKAIDSDLKALRSILAMFRLLPQGKGVDLIFDEVRMMLHQEIDYVQEAAFTKEYRDRVGKDERYAIPRVLEEYSTARVLASTFEEGVAVDSKEVQELPLERRNQLALSFLDIYFKEIFEWSIVQTDPHLGNYKVRIMPDGKDKLVLLDFGAVRRYEAAWMEPYHRMVWSSLFGDAAGLDASARDLRFVMDGDPPALKKLFAEFCFMTVEPFLDPKDARNADGHIAPDGSYDWKNSDLPKRLTKKVFEIIQTFSLRPPPREVLFLDRKTGGVFIFLSVLRAKLNGRPLLLSYAPKNTKT